MTASGDSVGRASSIGIRQRNAGENFVLALTAQGVSSCMMEGFDEGRVKRLLRLNSSTRVAMVIAIGYAANKGTWGPQWRLPVTDVFHQI